MLESSTLTLSGNDNFVVDGLVGDLNANPTSAAPLTTLTGSLEITTGDAGDDTIDITTGAGRHHDRRQQRRRHRQRARHRHGARRGDAGEQHADAVGQRQFRGRWPGRRPQRQPDLGRPADHAETGSLEITTGDPANADDTIDITTGAGNTTIDGNSVAATGSALDTVTVHAAAMLESSTLTLSGNDNFVVDGLVGDLNANPTSAAPLTTLTGEPRDHHRRRRR